MRTHETFSAPDEANKSLHPLLEKEKNLQDLCRDIIAAQKHNNAEELSEVVHGLCVMKLSAGAYDMEPEAWVTDYARMLQAIIDGTMKPTKGFLEAIQHSSLLSPEDRMDVQA